MKIITVIGARPQFVKASTVSRAIHKHNAQNIQSPILEKIIHTGQHYDPNMSDIFFTEMEIPKPDYTLGVGGGGHGQMTGRQLEKIEGILIDEKPDCLLVYGDTNSTLAGALAAAKLNIPVVHVEAGLRSFNMDMPEEINRILTDNISEILFCPTKTAIDNLKNDGFENKKCKIINVGDVMYDAAMYYSEKSAKPLEINKELSNFALVTIHRADNTDNSEHLTEIVNTLNALADIMDVVIPIHPRTNKLIKILGLKFNETVTVIQPVGYFEMIWLLKNCQIVLTDSGGLQKEAYFFKKYCLTLRAQTEWVELINAGVNELTEIDMNLILKKVQSKLSLGTSIFDDLSLYGDADAADRIVKTLVKELFRC